MGSNYGVYNLEITQTQPNSCIKSSFKNFDRKRLRIHGVDYVCYPKLPHVHGSYIVATSHLRLCKYFQCRVGRYLGEERYDVQMLGGSRVDFGQALGKTRGELYTCKTKCVKD